jgi:hypothetical protein
MSDLFMTTLPLSIAASISVTSILVFFAIMVEKERQLENGSVFIAGGVFAYLAIMIVVMLSFDRAAPASSPRHEEIHAVADFLLAGLCIFFVIKSFFKKDAALNEERPKKPRGFWAFFGLGALMRVASANTLPPFMAAINDVSAAQLSFGPSIFMCTLIILISMLPLLIPWLLFLLNREKAVILIKPAGAFLERHKTKISNTVLILIAVYLAQHGLEHLGML